MASILRVNEITPEVGSTVTIDSATTLVANTIKNPSSSTNNITLNADGSSTIPGASLTLGTSQTATSTSVDFTGIPSWVKRVTVMFEGVSTSGTSNPLIQLGDSGGIETSGYVGAAAGSGGATTFTAGVGLSNATAASDALQGTVSFFLLSGTTWVASGSMAVAPKTMAIGSSKTLSATLDRIRITTVNGTDTFDAGTINIMYE